ncbi:MAG: DNA-3-methyladenine glycosylase I, partial [Bacteroidota bacterium]|nr:DNA-3-methyladenine glycosylase I [Bacteroidota bacterium]
MAKHRCTWAIHPLEIVYHDKEWGVPVHDDLKHFEFLLLDTFQAGLSWLTILKKKENFRRVFDHFDYKIIAEYKQDKISELLDDAGIIRNRMKILASIKN